MIFINYTLLEYIGSVVPIIVKPVMFNDQEICYGITGKGVHLLYSRQDAFM